MDDQPIRLTLKKKTLEVLLDGDRYVLSEMNGKDRDVYVGRVSGQMRFNSEGKPQGLKSSEGLQSLLISLSLTDAAGKRVPESTILSWPAEALTALFAKAQVLSGLVDETPAVPAGNV